MITRIVALARLAWQKLIRYALKFGVVGLAGYVTDVTIFNSFIADAELGVAPMRGYEDLPDGTWFIHAKVNNDEVWQKVKDGQIKGFSVEGLFNYVPVAKVVMSAEARLAAIEKLLAGI